ncbi:hypothetical protein Lfu02_80150 [Longispora fulva]|uniref:Phage tail protein n=1 Tax=Longispora fulva TaxID=619741 RepID=A0A8J7KJQ9_9ACTN|nr:hypothetical protein [Longispora fulva]MBG6140685.1 hypothetical protein [Longispora fulva]GIG63643.1 hypothetical protein Lfu02_80150 [Longispora fulva]
MALSDDALIIPGIGYVYDAPAGTAKPASLTNPAAPWADTGHTSEDGLKISFEISKTKRKTWRARAGVRVSVDEISLKLGWTALQLDNASLSMYFGGGDISAPGAFGVLKSPVPVERALFIRLVDGSKEADIYVAKVAISAAGEVTASPGDFAGFELEAEVLDHAAAAHLMQWLAPNLGTPAGG